MSVRLGISPIGWSNDDLPELGGDIPLDTCLAETSEAGFEITSFTWSPAGTAGACSSDRLPRN